MVLKIIYSNCTSDWCIILRQDLSTGVVHKTHWEWSEEDISISMWSAYWWTLHYLWRAEVFWIYILECVWIYILECVWPLMLVSHGDETYSVHLALNSRPYDNKPKLLMSKIHYVIIQVIGSIIVQNMFVQHPLYCTSRLLYSQRCLNG